MELTDDAYQKRMYNALCLVFSEFETNGLNLDENHKYAYVFYDKNRTETDGQTFKITVENITNQVRQNIRNRIENNEI